MSLLLDTAPATAEVVQSTIGFGTDNLYTGSDGTVYGKVSYADYNVGLTYDYEGYLLGVKYYINDTKPGTEGYATAGTKKLYKDGFAVSILKAF